MFTANGLWRAWRAQTCSQESVSQSSTFKVPPRARSPLRRLSVRPSEGLENTEEIFIFTKIFTKLGLTRSLRSGDLQSAKWCEWSCLCFARPPRTRAKALEGEALPPADKTRDLCRVGCLPDRSYRYRSWPGSCVSLGVRESKVWAHISFMGVRLAPRYRGLRFSGHVPLCRGTTTWHEQAGSICG